MNINPAIFREFSIRGIADTELTDDVVMAIGRALGTYFNQQRQPLLVVGQDVRTSSARIGQTVMKGLLQTGLQVIDIGVVPTPLHNFATDFYQAGGGVMITASHNPPEYNGFKIRAAESLTGQTLRQIYRLAMADSLVEGQGTISQEDVLPAYVSALSQHAQASRSLKIVVDGGNGTNGTVVADFLGQQGHTVVELFTQPDGTFPNRNPDPTAKGALSVAAQTVVDQQADCGLAYDGDGDRVVLIDEQGGVHFGDIILMLLARQAAQQGPFKVVYDVSCTKALADDIIAHGGEAYPAPVGYTFIHHKMKETGATLGGETAGHIFCLDERFRFDDAILASVKLLNYITARNQPVSRLIADLPRYYNSPNYRLFCPDDLKAVVIQNLTAIYQTSHTVDTTDGVKIMFEHGWTLIRQSNTQPALTFRVEGKTTAEKERLERVIRPVIEQELAKLGVET